ncbi:type II toxin-antitoxin system YafQ family toxin [Paracoccus indicus]|uniref:type II toxin-antitoxin system RelE/ParE family toxin n=1 Tax=Paracoccus indicus TaxID=2079229 RepID=UPI000D357DFC|nr:type II toxin-antitoxin system YafQ family toxin [Paracoccus indicus]
MKALDRTTKFRRDLKREMKTDPGIQKILKPVISDLLEGKALPEKMKDHPLSGDWKDHRDCHLKPDLVLIYKIGEEAVTFVRLGSHSELF